jgi:hypothetical protein
LGIEGVDFRENVKQIENDENFIRELMLIQSEV